MPNNPQPIPAAAGYPQYSGTGLLPPIYSTRLQERFACEAIVPSITTTQYISEYKGRGDQLTFFKEPIVSTFEYSKDMDMPAETLELEPVTIGINKARAFNIKVDMLDEQMSPMWNTVLDAATKNAAIALKQDIDVELLAFMLANVDANNQGPNAGVQTGAYNLGSIGAPVSVTSANITEVLSHLSGVLDEQCIPQDGRYLVLPPLAKTYILNSQLSNASFMGGNGQTILLNGRIPGIIAGFEIYISSFLPSQIDPGTGTLAFDILAGIRPSTAFAMTLETHRMTEGVTSFSKYYQALFAYGYDVLRPEGLARLYATFA